jgi:TrpR family trp operon transcriptional repressor
MFTNDFNQNMKHVSKKIPEYKQELVEIFCKVLGDKELMTEFLKDILTPAEFESLALRWQIVKKLNKGETHRFVAGDLGLGISTVTRGSRELRNKNGGFHLMLKRLKL